MRRKKINANRIANEDKETEITFDLSLMELATEIGQVDTETFESPQDFLTHTPRLCQYLYAQASNLDTSISEYISSYLSSKLGSLNKNPLYENLLRNQLKWRQKNIALEKEIAALKQGFTENQRPPPAVKTKEEMILELRVKELQQASQLVRQMISDRLKTNHKLYAFSQIRKIEQNPLALEYDNLDKLFRYQTSIQRQLSSAIGELIYINKPREKDSDSI